LNFLFSLQRRGRACGLAILIALAGSVAPGAGAREPLAPGPWWQHAVIYEIYVRSFQDSNGDGIGDLKGITQRLDYLQELGVDALWLTPFFPSPNFDFGYDVSDYTDVSPEYGSLADWDELVREADRRGIRILVDFVLNHTSDQHAWFRAARSARDNPKRDWYVWRKGSSDGGPPNHWQSIFGGPAWTLDPASGEWYYHIFLPQQPDVNWNNPQLRAAMFEVAGFWLRRGAAGFRLDATPYLVEDPAFPDDPHPESGPPVWLKPYNSGRPETHEVLRQLRAVLGGFAGDPVLLGESATANIAELAAVYGKNHDEIQLPMNFLIGNLQALDAPTFKRQIDDAQLKLGGQTPVFFLSSHDHSRQWSAFGDGTHNDQIAKLTASLTLAPRGTALLYYGEELGMGDLPPQELAQARIGPKRPRADERDRARSPMQWTGASGVGFSSAPAWLPAARAAATYNVAAERADPDSILHWYGALIRLRHEDPAFASGSYLPLETGNAQTLAFARMSADGSGAVVALNASAQEQELRITGLPAHAQLREVILSSPAAHAPAGATLRLAPYGVAIVRLVAP